MLTDAETTQCLMALNIIDCHELSTGEIIENFSVLMLNPETKRTEIVRLRKKGLQLSEIAERLNLPIGMAEYASGSGAA